jgi:excinuclease ABC subunit C
MIPRSDYRTTNIPNQPGVYLFRDRLGTVIYVGKAKSLRRRLANYFQPGRLRVADPKLRSLIHSIAFYELFVVRSDAESLLLESRLIKQYGPRYNILLRDDKRFLLIKLDRHAPFPRFQLARVRKDDGCAYFGPYPVASALRDTVDFLTRRFGLRACTPRVPTAEDYEHCHADVIRHCCAPCVAKVTEAEYRQRVAQAVAVIEGDTAALLAELQEKMRQAAAQQQFERAGRWRDVMHNLRTVFGAQHRTFTRSGVRHYPGEAGVSELQEALALPTPPRHIECFDNSNLLGQYAVSSMVCFRDGAPAKSGYRHYRVKTVQGANDFATMAEIVRRRYRRVLAEELPRPDLIVIDGGAGQLSAAHAVLVELGLGEVPIIGLAKQQEEVYTTAGGPPLQLDRHAASLRLLQAIRDEAHRFAITFHHDLRRKRILNSLLDEVPGIGAKRKQDILRQFGSVRNLRHHDSAELLRRVPGLGQKLAEELMQHVQRRPAPPTATET